MSATRKKNGQRVFVAFGALTGWGRGTGLEAVTTERVAIAAHCSAPTARRYLDIMVSEGLIKKERHGHIDVWRVERSDG